MIKLPNETQLTLPCGVEITPEPAHYYEGLSHQDLPFHYALAELIDNSLSAYEANPRTVEIFIEKNNDAIKIKVSDKAKGIKLSDLAKKILRVGGQGTIGVMNEHGYGLKNALCVFTQNNRNWKILTKSSDNNQIILVNGPFRDNIQAEQGEESEWSEDLNYTIGTSGTRVIVETSYDYFSQMYPRTARNFDSLIIRLMEHLGVIYRGYLTDRRNNIFMRYKDTTNGVSDWADLAVIPITMDDVCDNIQKNELSIEYNGIKYPFTYISGRLSRDKVNSNLPGKPFPLKLYYQGNQKTQGVDIRVRGKVLMTHQIDYIWQDMERHNSLNNFIGELIFENSEFRTVNNKSKLSPQDKKWDLVRDMLASDDYKPSKSALVRTEESIRNKLKSQLEHNFPGSAVTKEFSTWDGAGVLIDIHMKQRTGDIWIYELKKGQTGPLDVYQLVMYWDGKVKSGERPKKGFLVASTCPDSVRNMINYWNERDDMGGEKYDIIFKTIDELMPPR